MLNIAVIAPTSQVRVSTMCYYWLQKIKKCRD